MKKFDNKDVVSSTINATERRLLKEFIDSVRADRFGCNEKERKREGRELLNLVRKRALLERENE